MEEPPVKGDVCSADKDSEEGTGKGGPTAQEREAPVPPLAAAEPDGGVERGNLPLVEEPPGQEGDYGTEEVAGWERGRDRRVGSTGRLPAERGATPE